MNFYQCFYQSFLLVQISALNLEGSSSSYAQFARWHLAANSSLELQFRTRQRDGLLLYMDDGGYFDFIEIKLVAGALRCRLNLGEGAETLSLGRDLHDGAWHRLDNQT